MACLTDHEIQTLVDNEATSAAFSHAAGCEACRARIAERRRDIAAIEASIHAVDGVPPALEARLQAALQRPSIVRGATALRGGTASPRGATRWIPVAAAAAGVLMVIAVVLPRLGAPTSLSAAEVLNRSLQTLSDVKGIEHLEYDLILSGINDGGYHVEHFIDHASPSRYRLTRYGSDGAIQMAVAQEPSTSRQSHLIRVDGRNYVFHVTTARQLPSLPEMAQAQVEAIIAMMQLNADQKLTVEQTPDGPQYVVEIPSIVTRSPSSALDIYHARAVISGGDFRIREFEASGALFKQPYSVAFRLIRREILSPQQLPPGTFVIEPGPDDVVLEGAASEPLTDVLAIALRELARREHGR